jgi:hypothetical protein
MILCGFKGQNCSVFLEYLAVIQLIIRLSAMYGIQNLITMITKALHRSYHETVEPSSHSVSLRSCLTLSSYLCLGF